MNPFKKTPATCATCEHSRQRVETSINSKGTSSGVALVCAYQSPTADVVDRSAVWPIVELNDFCNRYKYDRSRDNS